MEVLSQTRDQLLADAGQPFDVERQERRRRVGQVRTPHPPMLEGPTPCRRRRAGRRARPAPKTYLRPRLDGRRLRDNGPHRSPSVRAWSTPSGFFSVRFIGRGGRERRAGREVPYSRVGDHRRGRAGPPAARRGLRRRGDFRAGPPQALRRRRLSTSATEAAPRRSSPSPPTSTTPSARVSELSVTWNSPRRGAPHRKEPTAERPICPGPARSAQRDHPHLRPRRASSTSPSSSVSVKAMFSPNALRLAVTPSPTRRL